MGKYDKRSATTRVNTIKRHKNLVESKGFVFLEAEFCGSNTWLHFIKDGKKVRQHISSFKKGLRLRDEYLATCYPEESGLYRFFVGEEIKYIGKTKDFRERLSGHFTKDRSMVKHKNIKVTKIEYCQLGQADANILELYLLAKYKPEWNTKDVPDDEPSFEIKEPMFTEFTGWS